MSLVSTEAYRCFDACRAELSELVKADKLNINAKEEFALAA